MSFISGQFAAFFTLTFFLCHAVPPRFRWPLLLAASYLFYAYQNANHLLIIVCVTLTAYLTGIGLGRASTESPARRRVVLACGVGSVLSALFVFKYFDFVAESLGVINDTIAPLAVVLPIGISFYTFQAMSYMVDVYRKGMKPETHVGIFAAYIAFFPQLVAGPIERASNLLPQFHTPARPGYDDLVIGLRYTLWGVFKKVVVADNLALYVNAVYGSAQAHQGSVLILATVFFAFQIYCDFSGYSAIAVGIARMLGFRLTMNFQQPYLAVSLRDFWRRWHVTLSFWFRDYVYISLGGSRISFPRTLLNVMVVFALSGLWHGAQWTFVIWGLIHGLLLAGQLALERAGDALRLRRYLQWPRFVTGCITFALVCLAWVFFRASSFDEAMYIVHQSFNFAGSLSAIADPFDGAALAPRTMLILSLLLIALILVSDWLLPQPAATLRLANTPALLRWGAYYIAALLIIYSLLTNAGFQFIYFQF